MRIIVFSVIKENVKSFFHREEELTAQPKAIPATASEVFDKPNSTSTKIVQRSLPNPSFQETSTAKPPISPEQLRAALQRNNVQATQPVQPQQITQPTQNVSYNKPQNEIHLDIAEFEKAITAHEDTLRPKKEPVQTIRTTQFQQNIRQPNLVQNKPLPGGFFDEYQQFLMQEDLKTEGVLSQDIISRMREFHEHKKDGKEFYIMSKDLEEAAKRKLDELQYLEKDWFTTQEELDALQKNASLLEQEIEVRTSELRNLVQQAKKKSKLESHVEHGQEFIVCDGKKLSSLLDLKFALHNMSDDTFNHHVTAMRNDFASWTRACLHDDEIAKQIALAHNKEQLLMILGKLS